MLGAILLCCTVCAVSCSDVSSLSARITTKIISADGFHSETHKVTTEDGYILEMYRIPYGRNGPGTDERPVVLLMHGFMASSSVFIKLGANHSLAYNLADAGFDVWMGNARGNPKSRDHTTLDPDDAKEKYTFFNFTYEEIGLYDLPAMIDFALKQSGQKYLHYIGHSQGGTAFLVLMSLQPTYRYKVISAHLLAAIGYQENFPDEDLKGTAQNVDNIYKLALSMGIVELYPAQLKGLSPKDNHTENYCTGDLHQSHMCELFGIKQLLRDNSAPTESVAGAALKQLAHYGQNVRDKRFRRYHHGAEQNLEVYGVEEPPEYNMSLITTDVTLHYSVKDNLISEKDVLAMAADMVNTKVRKVKRATFQHSDYLSSLDAKELVTEYIIEALANVVEPIDVPKHDQELSDDEIEGGLGLGSVDSQFDNDWEGQDAAPDSATAVILNVYLILFSLFIIFR